jgi:hypothetical protein
MNLFNIQEASPADITLLSENLHSKYGHKPIQTS